MMSMNKNKFHWINDEVKIDFPVSTTIKNLMVDAERLDLEENFGYFNYAEAISDTCKLAYAEKVLTKEQWELIERRYPYA